MRIKFRSSIEYPFDFWYKSLKEIRRMRIKYPFQSKIDILHFETTSIFRSENYNFPSKLNPKDKFRFLSRFLSNTLKIIQRVKMKFPSKLPSICKHRGDESPPLDRKGETEVVLTSRPGGKVPCYFLRYTDKRREAWNRKRPND